MKKPKIFVQIFPNLGIRLIARDLEGVEVLNKILLDVNRHNVWYQEQARFVKYVIDLPFV